MPAVIELTENESNSDIFKSYTSNTADTELKNEFKIIAFIESIVLTLTSDLENGGAERTEVAALVCDNIVANAYQKKVNKCPLITNLNYNFR